MVEGMWGGGARVVESGHGLEGPGITAVLVDLISEVPGIEGSGTITVLEDSVELTSEVEAAEVGVGVGVGSGEGVGVGVGVAELDKTDDEEGLVRSGVSLSTTHDEDSSVYSSK